MRKPFCLLFLLLALGLTRCCPTRYAVVSLESVDSSGAGVSTYAYSGEDNSYLGLTNPRLLYYTRKSCKRDLTVRYAVQDTSRGIPMEWKLFKITRWAPSVAQSTDAAYLNHCVFIVRRPSPGTAIPGNGSSH